MQVLLQFDDPDGTASSVPLTRDRPVVAGYGDGVDLVLPRRDGVGERHAAFSLVVVTSAEGRDEERVRIEALGEATCAVGETAVRRARFKPPATVVLGPVRLRVVRTHGFERIVLPASRPRDPESFGALVRAELQRAPWFSLSLLLHALILLVLMWLVPVREDPPSRPMTLSLYQEGVAVSPEPFDDAGLLSVEDAAEVPLPEPSTPRADSFSPEAPRDDSPPLVAPRSWEDDADVWRANVQVLQGRGAGRESIERTLDPAFREKLRSFRRSGLEIVFVLDSTGSMEKVLRATKEEILLMVDVLDALVPTARIGIVTFRDRGPYEEYVTRTLPLGATPLHSINFLRTIEAAGGDDEPEAVLEGLAQAVGMPGRRDAQRVVVLIGDAPPHADSWPALEELLRGFTADGTNLVHVIGTESTGPIPARTAAVLQQIADLGRGRFQLLAAENEILRSVLTLAFGQRFERDLDSVFEQVAALGERVPTRIVTAAANADVRALRRALDEDRLIDEVARACALHPGPEVARMCFEKMIDPVESDAVHHAMAWALVEIFELDDPPIDPETGRATPYSMGILRSRLRMLEKSGR